MAAEKIFHFPGRMLPRLPPRKDFAGSGDTVFGASTAW
jgi:hypothetical protein